MIDLGLLSSMAVIIVVVFAVKRWAPPLTVGSDTLGGVAAAPVWAAIVVARLVAVSLDDPSALGRPRDLLLIRGGMEFWAGALAAAVVAAIGARRAEVQVLARLGDLAVYALVAYGAYEATCVLRDGCFGPLSAVGLRPRGMGAREIPVGLLVAAAVWALAVVVRALARRSGGRAVLFAAGGLGLVRFVVAFALPHIAEGATRPQIEALAVALTTGLISAGAWLWNRRSEVAASVSPPSLGGISSEEGACGATSAIHPIDRGGA